MNKSLINWWSGGGVSYTAEYQAILDRGTALGYSLPTTAQKTAQDNLIISLKAAGIWTKLDVFYCFYNNGGASFGKLNWKNPTLYPAVGTGHEPTFASNTGFTGNGSSMYLDTGWKQSDGVQHTGLDGGFFCDVTTKTLNSNAESFGCFDGSIVTYFNSGKTSTIHEVNFNGSVLTSAAQATALGFFHISNIGVNITIFRDGVSRATSAAGVTTRTTKNIYILCRNQNNSPLQYDNATLACWGAGSGMGGLESTFSSAWSSYKLSA